jgi:hypothetical protein
MAEINVIVGDRDCSEVERPVVQRTEGETVLDHVRAAVREPLHVRGLDADADLSDLSVVCADRAPVLVSAQHRWSEAGIAPRAPAYGSAGRSATPTSRGTFARMSGCSEVGKCSCESRCTTGRSARRRRRTMSYTIDAEVSLVPTRQVSLGTTSRRLSECRACGRSQAPAASCCRHRHSRPRRVTACRASSNMRPPTIPSAARVLSSAR